MERIVGILQSKGLKATSQRIAIYKALAEKGHASAEDIFDDVVQAMPTVSLGTIYSALKLFSKKEIVGEMGFYDGKIYFDITTAFHCHFICENCNRIFDVKMEICNIFLRKGKAIGQVKRFSGIFYGVCKACSINYY